MAERRATEAQHPQQQRQQQASGAHRVSDLLPSSSRPQMSRLPVRVKELCVHRSARSTVNLIG